MGTIRLSQSHTTRKTERQGSSAGSRAVFTGKPGRSFYFITGQDKRKALKKRGKNALNPRH
jgi:hypothetical protein